MSQREPVESNLISQKQPSKTKIVRRQSQSMSAQEQSPQEQAGDGAARAVEIPHDPVPAAVAKGLVVFTKNRCPFCTRVRVLFDQLGTAPQYIEAFGDDPGARELYDATAKATGHDTVPLVLVDGVLLGGCDDTCMAVDSGELQRRLNLPSVKVGAPPGVELECAGPGWATLFMFPPVANRWSIQGVGLIVCALAIITIVFRNESWAHWLVVGMGLDFVVRVVAGGTASMKGSLTLPIVALLPEQLVPGVPKQFAASCGVFFCTLAAALYLGGENGEPVSEVGGSVVVGILAMCAALEGFLNFCVGCTVFGILNALGVVPDTVYQSYTDLLGTFIYQISDMNRKNGWTTLQFQLAEGSKVGARADLLGWRRRFGKRHDPIPEPVKVAVETHPSGVRTALDFDYKFPKTDDTIREHWGPKYIQFEDFAFPLGVAAFAASLRTVASIDGLYVHREVYETIWIIAFVLHCLLLLGYLVGKVVLNPRKVYSDLQNSSKRLAIAAIPITHLVFAMMLEPEAGREIREARINLQSFLFWTGTIGVGLHFVVNVATWVKNRMSSDSLNPAFLFVACEPLVVPLVAPSQARHRGADYAEVGAWFLGLGLFFYFALFTITFGHGIARFTWADDRVRPMVALWPAGAFIATVGYTSTAQIAGGFDTFAFVLFAAGCGMFLVELFLVYPGRWLLRAKFDISNWAVAFGCNTFVFAAAQYKRYHDHGFAFAVLWIALVFAGWSTFTMFFHTLALLVGRKWPRAPQKWSPLSFNKLQHEAMRVMLAKMETEAAHPTPGGPEDGDGSAAAFASRLIEQWDEYAELVAFHARYEDDVLFPEIEAFNKAHTQAGHDQHEVLDAQVEVITKLKEAAAGAKSRASLERLKTAISEHAVTMLDHVQWEEDHMQPLLRKCLNLDLHVDIIRRVWASARDAAELEAAIVTVVRHLPMHGQRVRFIKALTWAVPERTQQVGAWLYRGLLADPLGEMKYALIVEEVPEMAPRGTYFWSRVL